MGRAERRRYDVATTSCCRVSKNNEKVIITGPVNKRNPVELAYTKAEIKLKFVYEKYISFVQNI